MQGVFFSVSGRNKILSCLFNTIYAFKSELGVKWLKGFAKYQSLQMCLSEFFYLALSRSIVFVV